MNTTNNTQNTQVITIFDKAAICFNKVEPYILYLAESVNGKQGIFLKLEHSIGNIFGVIRKVNPKRKVKAGNNKIIFKYYGQTYSLFLNEVMLIDDNTSRLFKMHNFRLRFEDADKIFNGLIKHFEALNVANQVKEREEEKPQTNQTVAPIDKALFDSLMGMATGQTGLSESEVVEYVDYVTQYIQNKREEMNNLKKQIQEISEDISNKSSEFVLEIQKRKEAAEKRREEEARKAAEKRREEEARKAAEEEEKKRQEKINSVREFLSGASDDMIQYLKAQLGINDKESEKKEDKESEKKSDLLKGDINMKIRVVPSDDDDSWTFYSKHVREICDHSTLPNKEILEGLVEKADGMTLIEIADAMGFKSQSRIVRINALLKKLKFDKILGTRIRKVGYKITTNKSSRVNGGVTKKINCEIYDELVSEYIK